MLRSLALAGLAALTVATAPAAAAVAPGRVAFSVATQVPERNVDAGGAGPAVALPGGGVVMIAYGPGADLTLVQMRADGSLDASFGSGGVARVELPGGDRYNPAQLLRRPDGRLLVVGTGFAAANPFELPRFVLVGLTAAGGLDPSLGAGGIAPLDLQSSCGGGCAPAALAPDGSIVITGQTGRLSPGIVTDPNVGSSMRWVVRRLAASGASDPGFGDALVSGPAGVSTSGYGTVVRPSGAIVVLGIRDRRPHLAGLTATGAPDPSFNGGQLAALPVDGAFRMLLRSDGAIDVTGDGRLVRFTPAGAIDASYGTGGFVSFGGFNRSYGPPATLATPDGATILYGLRQFEPTPAAQPRLQLQRVTRSGALGAAGTLSPAFGGGIANTRAGVEQNGFRGGLVPRADGSYLALGALSVVRYTGEGEGFSAGYVAAAAYTPLLEPDTTFGGPQLPARARVRVPRQRARSAAELRRVLVRVTTSGAGLMTLRVRDGRGRVLARTVAPAYAAGTTSVRIPLTTTGRRILRRGRSLRVRVGRDFRDILTARDRGVTSARLR
ncbi:MAG: hypothetical protein Q8K79_00635 [Solirubrobacteraceae bacterium]|nr:hypothetical protein [Solirubrobacteraceae bacterium]